jgi:hypothetical protein
VKCEDDEEVHLLVSISYFGNMQGELMILRERIRGGQEADRSVGSMGVNTKKGRFGGKLPERKKYTFARNSVGAAQ